MRLAIPKGAFVVVKEIARHVLRRPVVGVVAAARTSDGRWLLVRRADVGEWALAGGTLEWGETLHSCITREIAEEAGIDRCEIIRLVGIFSRPERDRRFHAVTVVVECVVEPPVRPPSNPVEIIDVAFFSTQALPRALAMGMRDMLDAAIVAADPVFE